MEKKKIGLLGAILMGIGCIVGSGIFGTLPTVANEYGAGVVWALIGAAAVVVLCALASTYSSAALPASGSQFLWAAKLMHPIAGAFVSFSTLLMPTMVSLFGVLFGMYLQPLFPNTEINGTVAAVALLVVFAVVAWFGNKTTINTGNVMVVLLLIAIALYIFLGLPHIDTANVTFGQIVRPGVSISTLAAAVGVLTSSLSGASSVAQVADDVKNPGKTVPLALVLCPAIVAVIYILMAVVTIGVIPAAEVTSLSDVAAQFMSPALLTFFIVGGPICGIITSLIPVALAEALLSKGVQPRLVLLRCGDNEADGAYIRGAVKRAALCGVAAELRTLPADASADVVAAAIDAVNRDPAVHGCLLLRPLPPHLRGEESALCPA